MISSMILHPENWMNIRRFRALHQAGVQLFSRAGHHRGSAAASHGEPGGEPSPASTRPHRAC